MANNDMFKPPAERAAPAPTQAAFSGSLRAIDYLEHTQTVAPSLVRANRQQEPVEAAPLLNSAAPAAAPLDATEPDAVEDVIMMMPTIAAPQAAGSRHAFVPPAAAPTKRRAQRGLKGALARAGLPLAPSAADLANQLESEAADADVNTIRQATWSRAVGILVANRKGGVGKTPTSLVIGGILASIRGGSVSVLEVSDDPGALEFRAEGVPTIGLGELVRDAASINSAGQLAGYTALQSSFASVIGTVGRRERLSREAVSATTALLDRFYAIRVMDSGNQPTSDAFAGAVEAADVLVIPIFEAGDAVLGAVALLEELSAAGEAGAVLARRAIVLRIADGRPVPAGVKTRVDASLVPLNLAGVFEIPFDAHIAERGDITLSKLAPATYRAFTAAAAAIVRVLTTHVR